MRIQKYPYTCGRGLSTNQKPMIHWNPDITILDIKIFPVITMKIQYTCTGKFYSKMYGTKPRYIDLQYNDIPDIIMRI